MTDDIKMMNIGAKIDERLSDRIDYLAIKHGLTKGKFITKALEHYCNKLLSQMSPH